MEIGCQNEDNQDKVAAQEQLKLGRLLNKGVAFNQEAFNCLTESVKLDPTLVDSWIELAECYQRKSDTSGAIACLESAMKYGETQDKRVLRNLSACLRSHDLDDPKLKYKSLLDSLELSKQALKLDMNDPENYYNLGKAYMCLFFFTSCCDRKLMALSRMAFEKALSLSTMTVEESSKLACYAELQRFKEIKTDFLFNFSTILLYEQDFQRTLDCLNEVIQIDHAWREPKELLETVQNYMTQINSILKPLQREPKKLPRKYRKDVETLAEELICKTVKTVQADQKRLYRMQEIQLTFQTLSLSDIEPAISNPGDSNNNKDAKIIHFLNVKPIEMIDACSSMYLTFIAIDKNLDTCVITMFNVSNLKAPTSRDVITIVDPHLERVKVNLKCQPAEFNMIKLREFKDFYINGARIDISQVAKPQVKVSMLPNP